MRSFFLFAIIAFSGCFENQSLDDVVVTDLHGKPFSVVNYLSQKKYTAMVFIAPDCPLCIASVPELIAINDSLIGNESQMTLVFSGNYYSETEMSVFHDTYLSGIAAIRDTACNLAKKLHVEVTPEAVLVDSKGNILYKGLIDDRAADAGVKRQAVSRHYLRESIACLMHGQNPVPALTTAKGCFIEK